MPLHSTHHPRPTIIACCVTCPEGISYAVTAVGRVPYKSMLALVNTTQCLSSQQVLSGHTITKLIYQHVKPQHRTPRTKARAKCGCHLSPHVCLVKQHSTILLAWCAGDRPAGSLPAMSWSHMVDKQQPINHSPETWHCEPLGYACTQCNTCIAAAQYLWQQKPPVAVNGATQAELGGLMCHTPTRC